MGRFNFSYSDIETAINKLPLELKAGRERSGFVVIKGKKLFLVTVPNVHGHGQQPSIGFIRSMIDDLHINEGFFKELVQCSKKQTDYMALIASSQS